jgi:SAM-dependent methyltransferase
LEKEEETFDVIIFSSSFMLMPFRDKALEIAKSRLNPNGSIYFLMTLYDKKGMLEQIIGYVKPYLKYLTTIDFG